VENHAGWHERVKAQLAERNVTNVDYRLLEVIEGPEERNTPYVRVVDSIADNSLGFALVDGMARATCANEVITKVKPGGLLVVDNINWFLDHPTHSPASRFRKGHRDELWRSFAERMKNWRMIWTSSGVTDTAIWIKPA
jgi:predicted O-methyltransferase YrrM